jgi:hypothetical protein
MYFFTTSTWTIKCNQLMLHSLINLIKVVNTNYEAPYYVIFSIILLFPRSQVQIYAWALGSQIFSNCGVPLVSTYLSFFFKRSNERRHSQYYPFHLHPVLSTLSQTQNRVYIRATCLANRIFLVRPLPLYNRFWPQIIEVLLDSCMLQAPPISPPCKYNVLYFRMYLELYRCCVRTGIRFWFQIELRLQEIRFVPGAEPRWRQGVRRCWYVLPLACMLLYDAGLGIPACSINNGVPPVPNIMCLWTSFLSHTLLSLFHEHVSLQYFITHSTNISYRRNHLKRNPKQ